MATQLQRRPRAVADAPVQALLDRAEQLARSWALALIAARPLAEIEQLPLAEIARAGLDLCAGLARALASDEELERLAGGRRAAPQASPAGPIVADLELLRSIVWEATVAELRDPPPRMLIDLADRLSYACSVVLAATLEASRGVGESISAERAAPRARTAERVPAGARDVRVPAGSVGVLVDEAGQEPRPLAEGDDAERPRPLAGDRAQSERERAARPGSAPAAWNAGERAPRGGSSASGEQLQRPAPRARPWDTPLGDEPTLRVRRGPDGRVDDRG